MDADSLADEASWVGTASLVDAVSPVAAVSRAGMEADAARNSLFFRFWPSCKNYRAAFSLASCLQ
jgi:hypothetical protein